jgi:PAS domain S-box-containing protein
VAERQRVVEAALREAEERFRAIYEGTNDAMMLLTPDGFFDCNPRTLDMFGFKTKEEFTAAHPMDVSPPFQPDGQVSLSAAQAQMQTAYAQGYARFDWVHRRTNGQDFPAEVLLSAFDLGGRRVLQATVRDITVRQRVEEALRASEAEMRALFAAMTDVILVLDAEGRYIKVASTNPPLLYRPAATLEGQTLHEILPQSQADLFLGYIQQALASNQPVNFEYSLALEDELTWFVASVSPMSAERVVWVARDITAHKRLEQQVRESLERRERQVQTSTEVAQEIATAPALEELFQRVVTLIKERFGYYHAQIFRYDPTLDAVVLVSGYGAAGQEMLAAGHKLALGRGVVGAAADTGQSILATDVAQDKDWRPNPHLPDTQGELAVPIKLRDQVLGILDVQSATAGALTVDDQLLLEGLCGQIAIVIDNVRLFAETQQRVNELAILNEIGREFAAMLTIEETCQAVYRQVNRLFKADNFVIGAYQAGSMEWAQLFVMHGGQPGEIGVRRMGRDLTSFILSTGQPVLLRDLEENERFHREQSLQSTGPTAAAWMGAPLIAGGAVVGFMAIQEEQRERVYNAQHLALFSTVASQAAIAFQNARLFERARRHAEETAALNELSRTLSARLDVSQVLEQVCQGVLQLMNVASFYIGLYDAERNEVTFPINVTESVVDRQVTVIPADQGLTGHILQSGESLLISANVAEWQARRGIALVGEPAQSWLGVPMMIGDQVLGVMAMQDHRRPNAYSEHDRDLLESIAAQATIAIQNARLFEETQETLAETQALLRLSSSIISFENLSHLLQSVVDNVAALLPADRVSLKSFDLEKRTVTHIMQGGPGASHIPTTIPFDEFWDGLSGWVMRERQPALSLKDVPDPRESLAVQQRRRETDCGAVIVTPLVYRDHVLGTMTAINRLDQPNFTPKNVDLMVAMANQAAAAMENARLFEETQRALNEAQTLYQASQAVAESETAQEMLDVVIKHVLPAGADRVSLLRIERTPEGDPISVEVVGFKDLLGEYQRLGVRLPIAALPIVARLGAETLVIQDVSAAPEIDPVTRGTLLKFDIIATCLAPLRVGGQLTGIMTASARQPTVFAPHQVRLLHLIVDRIAAVLENRRLFERVQVALVEVQQSEQLLRTLMDNIPNPIFYKDSAGVYQGCNSAFEAYLGMSREQIIGHSVFDMAPKDLADQYHAKDVELFEQPGTQVYDSSVVYADGTRHDVIFNKATLFSPDGSVGGLVGVIIDITERKQFEASLTAERNLMRLLIDATPDWIFIKDQEHRYRLVNQGYANALHRHPEAFIGRNDLELGFPEELVKGNPDKGIRGFWTDDRLVMDTGETQVYPNDPATIDGVVHTFHTIKTPLHDADGNIWGVLAFARDVTALEQTAITLRQREAQMQAALDELERLNRATTREGWRDFLKTTQLAFAYEHDQSTIQPAQDLWMPRIEQAILQNALVPSDAENEAAVAPLTVRGTVIGALGVYDDPQRPLAPDELALLQEILEQGALALENARLYQDTQRRAARERMTREITDAVQSATDMESLMRIATEELVRALGGGQGYMRLGIDSMPQKSEQHEGEPENAEDSKKTEAHEVGL